MRKLSLLSIAVLGLATAPAFAQGSNSGPQPGLPPGANTAAPNAGTPAPSGTIATTPMPATGSTGHVTHRRRHQTTRHHSTSSSTAPAAQ